MTLPPMMDTQAFIITLERFKLFFLTVYTQCLQVEKQSGASNSFSHMD